MAGMRVERARPPGIGGQWLGKLVLAATRIGLRVRVRSVYSASTQNGQW
jgi:hypothetical protein